MDNTSFISTMQTALIIFTIINYTFIFIGLYKIFQKAGVEGYKGLIPIYNTLELLKIIGKPWWWVFLISISFLAYLRYIIKIPLPYILAISCVGRIWSIWQSNMLSKSFGHSTGFTLGLVFFPYVFYMILGFNDDKYLGPYGDPEAFHAYQAQTQFDFEKDVFDH